MLDFNYSPTNVVVNTSKSGRGECSYDFGEGGGVSLSLEAD